VLAVLVIMAMVVAVGAQRALVGVRESALALARAEMSGAAAGALSGVLAVPLDTARLPLIVPGALLASGSTAYGSARAAWTLTGAVASYATVEVDSRCPVIAGTARELRRVIVRLRRDSAGGAWWVAVGGGGRGRIPLP
jgi:hypothetical protein